MYDPGWELTEREAEARGFVKGVAWALGCTLAGLSIGFAIITYWG